jgi:DNA-binding CsgD family transcriptional regulator
MTSDTAAPSPDQVTLGQVAGHWSAQRPPFVGRERELRQLRSAFEAAATGHGGLVLLVGEPGIGKTALCEQLGSFVAGRSGLPLVGHCYEEGSAGVPYQPFVEAFECYAREHGADALRSALGPAASDIARLVPSVRDVLQVELTAAGNPKDDRVRLLRAVLECLRRLGEAHPLLLVLEDLHDADRGTLDLLVYLARNLARAPVLLVGSYRDVEVDRAHPLAAALAELRRTSHVERLQLGELSVDEVQRLLASSSQQTIPRPLAELVHRRTGGNPLFAHELLRFVLAEQLVEQRDGALRRVGDESVAGRMPEGLRDVVGKRLSRLSTKTNQVLGVASVIGREFQLDVLRRVCARSEDELESALEEAAAAGIVQERSVVGATITYRFSHAFFQQTLYEEIIAPRRIRLHHQVARVLEDVHAPRLNEHAAELAEHYAFSSDTNDLARAVEYGQLAAKRATDVFAYGEAARQLERALHVQDLVDPPDLAKRCDLLAAFGEALALAGDTQRAISQIAPEALGLAERLADQHRAFRVCRVVVDAYEARGGESSASTPDYLEWAERACLYAEPDSIERAHADLALANAWVVRRRLAEARTLRLEALTIARRWGDPEALFQSAFYVIAGFGTNPPEYWAERVRLADEATHWPREGVSGRSLERVLWHAGLIALAEGDRARAVELWSQLADLARRTQLETAELAVLEGDAWLAIVDGRLQEAWLLLDRFIARGEELGAPLRAREYSLTQFVALAEYLGRAEDFLTFLEDYFIARGGAGRRSKAGMTFQAVGLALAGRANEARSLAGPLLDEESATSGDDAVDISALLLLLQCANILQHREATRALAARLACLAHLSMGDFILTIVARQLGAAAVLNRDRVAARAYYAQALETGGKIGFRPDLALTRLQFAEMLLEEGERSEAREHLELALPELEAMHMQPALERALGRMQLVHRRASYPGSAAADPHSLTSREREVARLLAAGRSNREIAEALVITEGTVEVHVKHILSKLGFHSRSQVAAWVLEQRASAGVAPSNRSVRS